MSAVDLDAAPLGQDMQRQWHFEFLRCRPERIIVRMPVWFVVRRRTPDKDAADADFGAAFQFFHRGRNIAELKSPKPDQALGIVTTILSRPIIEAAETRGSELR